MTRRAYVLDSQAALAAQFSRCCQRYDTLSMAVAWCGDPKHTLPYTLLQNFSGPVRAVIGTAFNHTHPDAIRWLLDIEADVRVFSDEQDLFHPKLYFFRSKQRYAAFIGSSNFTYGGFYRNHEINCLIEGTASGRLPNDIAALNDTFSRWHGSKASFRPTDRWLEGYRQRHMRTLREQRKRGISAPPISDADVPTAGWLKQAEWSVYYSKVLAALKHRGENSHDYFGVFHAAARELALPWTPALFADLEKRRMIGGIGRYGSLGHVAASGHVRHLFARGSATQRATICNAVNAIGRLEPPISWTKLTSQLSRLVSLGPSMRVWGRILCLIRPDLYCTVSARSVRQGLSEASGIPISRFDRPDGYVALVYRIHASPWFLARRPSDKDEAAVWRRRTALLDAILYQS